MRQLRQKKLCTVLLSYHFFLIRLVCLNFPFVHPYVEVNFQKLRLSNKVDNLGDIRSVIKSQHNCALLLN